MPAPWASATEGSARSTTITVRTVFRCVAPPGVAEARATYGRSCSTGQPVANGWQNLHNPIRPCAHPLEDVQNPGWSAQRYRRGRRCKASRRALQNFSAKKSAASLRSRSPHDGRRHPRRKAAIFSLTLERPPLASAGAARHAKTGLLSVQLSQAPVQNLRFTTNRDHRSRGPAAPHRPAPVPLGTRKLELASTTTAVRLTRKTTLPHSHCPRALAIHSILPSAK